MVTMATSHVTPHQNQIVPLHLSGNTTEQQNAQLQEFLGCAVLQAYRTAIEQLDQQSAQAVLDMHRKLKAEVAERIVEIIHRHTFSDKYKDEEVGSDRTYPPTYRVRPLEAQVTRAAQDLSRPGQMQRAAAAQAAARRALRRGSPFPAGRQWRPRTTRQWRWCSPLCLRGARFPTALSARWATFLRQSERSKLAEKILGEQQEGTTFWWWARRPACCIAARRRGGRA
jgi:hypothetical protein